MSPLLLYQLKGHQVSDGHAEASSLGLHPIEFIAPQLRRVCVCVCVCLCVCVCVCALCEEIYV